MEQTDKLISIVVPVFNRAHIVPDTINSVISQTYPHWELILVDDGSTDNISEVIEAKYCSESRVRLIKRNRSPKGGSTCRNIGVENAKGNYIIFLDSDDLLEPFCLEQRIKAFNSDENLDFAVFRFKFLNVYGQRLENSFNNGKDPLLNFLSGRSYWNVTCPIWKKKFLLKIEGFNDKFLRYQDVEMNIRSLTYPNVKYSLFFDLPPDAVIVPSIKKSPYLFAYDISESLMLLIPQTYNCLKKGNINIKKMRYMESYLRDWLKLISDSHFDDMACRYTKEVFNLFSQYGIVTNSKLAYYKSCFYLAEHSVKTISKLYSKIV